MDFYWFLPVSENLGKAKNHDSLYRRTVFRQWGKHELAGNARELGRQGLIYRVVVVTALRILHWGIGAKPSAGISGV
jgi:hypothetical protein